MWIRSQDKMGLFKAIGFKIREHGFEDGTKEFIILSNDNLYNVLGTYKSKERAIEVLDEIQNKIMAFELGKANRVLSLNEVVYQIPNK